MKYIKYYITPFLTFSVILGIFLGGHWMFLGLAVIFFVMIFGDALLREDHSQPEYSYPFFLELPLNLALPIGISFYTFQSMSYIIDIYRGSLQPSKTLKE